MLQNGVCPQFADSHRPPFPERFSAFEGMFHAIGNAILNDGNAVRAVRD
jgi:hypothetical protein